MKLIVIVALFVVGANSVALQQGERDILTDIQNSCILESGLNLYEIANIFKAIRPNQKIVDGSKCFVRKITELQAENETMGKHALKGRTFQLLTNNLPQIASGVLSSCKNLLGQESCFKIIELTSKVVDIIQNQLNLLQQS